MAAESITGLSTMENDIKMLSCEKQIIDNESDNLFKMSVADMEKEREGLSNELKDTIEKCNILSSDLEKAMLSKKEVQTLLEENQKLKNDNRTLLAEHDDLKAQLQNLDMDHFKLRETITDTKAENESLIKEKHLVQGLKSELETKLEEKSQQISNLQETIKDLEAANIDMHTEVTVQQEQKTTALAQLQQVEASLKNLENQLDQQREKNSDMTNDIARFEKQMVEVRRSLHDKIGALHEEKDATLLELHASQASVTNLENVIEQQNMEFLSIQRANDELLRTIHTLTTESEQDKAKLKEEVARLDKQLVELRRSLHAKIAALHEDKDATLLQLQESQSSVRNFESVIEVQNEKISYLQQNNDELQKVICTLTEESEQDKAKLQGDLKDMTNKNIAWLEKQLVEMRRTLHAKIAALHQEKDAALLELHASQASVMNSESVVEQQKEKISSLQQDKDELQKTIYTLTHELDQAKAKFQEEVSRLGKQLVEVRRSLHAKIAPLHEEKDAILLDLLESQASIRNFEGMVVEQKTRIMSLQENNDELQKTIYTSYEDREKTKAKFQEELGRSNKQLLGMRRSLQTKIAALHQEKDASLLKLQKYQASMRNFECVVEEQNENILSLQQANDELQKTIYTLIEESEQAKAKLQDEVTSVKNNVSILENQLVEVRRSLQAKIVALHQEKDAALLELLASQASVRNLESVVEEQNESISYLQQAHDELQKIICTLNEESEQGKANLLEELKQLTNNNISRLEKQLVEARRSLHAKIAALHEEKDATLLDLHASQACVRNFENIVVEQKAKIMSLQQDNDELQKTTYTLIEESEQGKAKLQEEAKAMTNNVVVLEKQLVEVRKSLHAKMAALREDNDVTLLELQATRAFIRKFESVVEEQNENISSLQESNDEMHKTLCSVIEESERAKVKHLDEVKTTQEEKDIVVTRLKQSESYIKNLENEVARLIKEIAVQLENNSKLDKHLEEATLKASKLNEKLEKSQAEMASHIDDMNLKTKELEDTIDALSSQKTKVEEDLKMLVEACSGNMSKMKEFEDTVKHRTTNDVTRFRPLHQSLKEVLSRYQKLQCAYDELSARTSRFEVLKQNQMEQVDKIRQLKEEKLNTFMENTKLHKHVQDLEIQLQHVKQKLMENKWKEDRFAATLETSKAEIQNLEQLVSLLEETLQEIKEHAESGVFSMVEQLDKLESSFSQGFPRFVYRSSASNEELKVLRNKLYGHLDEQKELLKKDGLAIRLRNKEKVFSEMVRNDAEERILDKKVEEKESGEERTNNTSKRWPILRRRKWRRNSYSC